MIIDDTQWHLIILGEEQDSKSSTVYPSSKN